MHRLCQPHPRSSSIVALSVLCMRMIPLNPFFFASRTVSTVAPTLAHYSRRLSPSQVLVVSFGPPRVPPANGVFWHRRRPDRCDLRRDIAVHDPSILRNPVPRVHGQRCQRTADASRAHPALELSQRVRYLLKPPPPPLPPSFYHILHAFTPFTPFADSFTRVGWVTRDLAL